ncbi:caspase family protein [Marinovum sp.]|uniref:caspase family protein n=1 Tax=Marinovum sp. TaxID=2024839 RepID=UPI002B272102|nr:caspase family protein [Marinovum sp.]
MTRRIASLSLLALASAAAPASAEIRALLVGVSDYQHLDADLRGPANDVGLMARALMARGAEPAAITVLAAPSAPLPEGVVNAGLPTRAAILDGLADLAATSGQDTHAVFYFSGHGTQMPDTNGDEQGGYDEIFLPADAKGWNGASGTVENAIIDDEMTPRLQAILDRGAVLFAMLDACHSETGFRALPDSAGAGVARYVAPALLAMPTDLSQAEAAPAAPPLTGDFVFLYAAQQDQRAFEYPLGDPADPANWYGDFTRAVAMVLESGAALTWAGLLQQSMAEMNANAPAAQTPDAEGSLLNAAVLGQTEALPPVLRVAGGALQAGALQGVRAGAVYEIFAAAEAEPVALATVIRVAPTSARLQSQQALPYAGFARLKTPGQPQKVRLAGPVRADGAGYAALRAEIARLQAAEAPDGVTWTEGPADYTLVLTKGALALAGRDGVVDGAGPGSAPRVMAPGGLLDLIERAVRVFQVRSATQQVAASRTGLSLGGFGPKYRLSHVPVAGADAACEGGTAAEAQPVSTTVTVTHCDQLWLEVSNPSQTARDITVLYIDADNRITAIWPEAGLSNRVGFDETIEAGLLIQNPGPQRHGLEEILVLAVPAEDKAPRTVLTALADPAPTRAIPEATPGAAAWLLQATLPDAPSRSLTLPGAMSPLEVTRFAIKLEPG